MLLAAGSLAARAQNVGIGTTAPNASAKLDVNSTTQGFLPPRLTATQRDAIVSPVAGLLVFQTDGTRGIYYYSGLTWVNLTNGRAPDATGSTGAAVSTLAGTAGRAGSTDGTGAAARFNRPYGLAVDATGVLYVADGINHTIRVIR